jgi:hypothetical protein
MKGLKTIAAAAALTISGAAIAGPSYTFVDLGYLTGDSGDDRTDGLGLRGSFGFAGLWHVAGEYSALEASGGKGSATGGIDVSGGNIYVGLHPAVTDNTDLIIDLGYDLLEGDDGSTSGKTDVTSIFLRTGPRALLAGDKLELSAYVSLAVGEFDPDTSAKQDFTNVGFQIGGQYYFTPAISLGVEAQVNGSRSGPSGGSSSLGNDDLVRIFGRWSFGRR